MKTAVFSSFLFSCLEYCFYQASSPLFKCSFGCCGNGTTNGYKTVPCCSDPSMIMTPYLPLIIIILFLIVVIVLVTLRLMSTKWFLQRNRTTSYQEQSVRTTCDIVNTQNLEYGVPTVSPPSYHEVMTYHKGSCKPPDYEEVVNMTQ